MNRWVTGALASLVIVSAPGAETLETVAEPELEVVADRVELRWSSTGRLLGWLARGTEVERLGGRDGWTRLQVSGWVRSGAVEAAGDAYRVTEADAPLRSAVDGARVGGLVRGVEVRRIDRADSWYEVELIAWVPDETVGEPVPAPETTSAARPTGARSGPSAIGRLGDRTSLLAAPEGDAVTEIPAGTPVRALETRGGWTRVAVEGWVRSETVRAGAGETPEPDVVASAAPDAFTGRSVTWTLEHVALQRADEWRRDFASGETYALARVPDGEGLYVYVVVPEALIASFEDLSPFATFRIAARVRVGRSELTGNPIVEAVRLLP